MIKYSKFFIFFIVTAVATGILISPPVMSKGRIEITPMITFSQVYDDNIFLEKDNKISDYITTISPGIQINATSASRKNRLNLEYSPAWVKYYDYSDNNTIRHNANLDFSGAISKKLSFNFIENYLKSEKSAEETFAGYQERQSFRHSRYTYQRNYADAGLTYNFGPKDKMAFGYRHEFLKNKDPELDDSTVHGPYGNLTYWFNARNGMELSYQFTSGEYQREDGTPSGNDYDDHEGELRYMYQFTPRTMGYISYGYTVRDYKEESEQTRKVHEGSAGLTHDLPSGTSLSLSAGYYKPEGSESDDSGHVSYSANLNKKFKRGSISLGGKSGWDDEDSLSAEQKGYTRYWEVNSGVDYMLSKNLNAYADGSCKKNKYLSGIEDDTSTGKCGLKLKFLRWYSLGLEYTYLNRRSDDPDDEYVDNQIMLTISAQRPFRKTY